MDNPEEIDEATRSAERDCQLEQFCAITSASRDDGKRMLEACNWNLEFAINMHVDSADCQSDPIIEPPPLEQPVASSSQASTSTGLAASPTEVRAPIPSKRQVLVEEGFSHSYSTRNTTRNNASNPSVFDAFRDFRAEARWQEELQRDAATGSERYSKRKTLEDLFRPPLDLMYRGSMDSAREEGSKRNKWLMVNIQDVREFACQVLNRDIWSNAAVKSLVEEHFVFWQVYHDSSEGQRYMQFYSVVKFPYVAILDPRTGEMLKSWSTIDNVSFCDMVTQFLTEHPSPSGNRRPASSSASATNSEILPESNWALPSHRSLLEESEEAQLKAAIEASLKENVKDNDSVVVADDDSDGQIETFESDPEDELPPQAAALSSSEKRGSNESAEDAENWRTYLGSEEGNDSKLLIRYPDGENREQVSFPANSLLKALLLYVASKGYKKADYDLVTNFPRRNLSELSGDDTLLSLGLHPRETVFVEHKS